MLLFQNASRDLQVNHACAHKNKEKMSLLVILYLIGSGLGGLLAIGTCWSGAKRYIHRSVALRLAQPFAMDANTVAVLASHHASSERAAWLVSVLTRKMSTSTSSSPITLLDICGATHIDLIEQLFTATPESNWEYEVFDSQPAMQFLLRNPTALALVEQKRLIVNAGASLEQISAQRQVYDFVLVLDNIVHSMPPHKRLVYFKAWAELIKPNEGFFIVVMETDPYTETSEAGMLQNVFHRMSVAQLRLLLESSGLGQCETEYFDNKVCVVARKHVNTLHENSHAAWAGNDEQQ